MRRVQTATGTGARSNAAPGPQAVQGTLGGVRAAIGARPGGRSMVVGDQMYLWVLVLLEVAAISYLRSVFSRYHGG